MKILEQKVIRFIIAGSTAFGVNIIALFLLTEFVGLWYILSATIAFVTSLLVGFSMNKSWTFGDVTADDLHKKIFVYFSINIINLILNNSILYFLVETWGVWYLLAQALASSLIAFESFFLYKKLFKTNLECIKIPT